MNLKLDRKTKVYLIVAAAAIIALLLSLAMSYGVVQNPSHSVTITVEKKFTRQDSRGIGYYIEGSKGRVYGIGHSSEQVVGRIPPQVIYDSIIIGETYHLLFEECRSQYWGIEGFQRPVKCQGI